MTFPTILPTILPVVAALLGPAEGEPATEGSVATVDPTEEAASSEGEPATDEAGPPEAGPPEPDPWSDADTESPAEEAPVAEEPAPAESAPVTTPAPVVTPTPAPPPEPRPIRWRLDLGVGGGGTVVGDLGYRAFSDNRRLNAVAVESVFDFRLAEGRVFLGGGLSYQYASRNGSAHGSLLDDYVSLHEPEVLGRVSVMAVEGIDVYGLVGVGPSFASLETYSLESALQDVVLPRVDGHAGLSLYLPKKWLPRKQASRITAGIQLGAGYTWRGKLEVQPSLVQGDDPLTATTSPWGDLSLHGFSWRAGLFVRLM